MIRGNIYRASGVREAPHTPGAAADLMNRSAFLRAAMGDDVITHYTRAATWEVEEQKRVVTDWEVQRGLERA